MIDTAESPTNQKKISNCQYRVSRRFCSFLKMGELTNSITPVLKEFSFSGCQASTMAWLNGLAITMKISNAANSGTLALAGLSILVSDRIHNLNEEYSKTRRNYAANYRDFRRRSE
jgi:hypothetical protein